MASRDPAWPCPAPEQCLPASPAGGRGPRPAAAPPHTGQGAAPAGQRSVRDLASPEWGAWQAGERELRPARRARRTPSTEGTRAPQVLSYLSGAVQPVRNVHELSLRFRANAAAIPFQGHAVDHHKAEAEGASRESGAPGDCLPAALSPGNGARRPQDEGTPRAALNLNSPSLCVQAGVDIKKTKWHYGEWSPGRGERICHPELRRNASVQEL